MTMNQSIDRKLKAERPDRPIGMQLRDRTNRRRWDHLLHDSTEGSEIEAEHAGGSDLEEHPLFDAPLLDTLPEQYLKSPARPSRILDDELACD